MTFALHCLALSPCAAQHVTTAPNEKFSLKSPDRRFIFRQVMDEQDGDDSFGVVNTRTNRPVPIDKGVTLAPMGDSLDCVWAPDSKHFALNARVGGRYDATELYAWNGRKFRILPDIEKTIATRLDTDRKAQLRKAGVPPNTSLRRIWDIFKTLQWMDARTLKILGSSTRSYASDKAADDTAEVVSAFTFTIKLDDKGRARIIAKSAAPAEGNEDEKK